MFNDVNNNLKQCVYDTSSPLIEFAPGIISALMVISKIENNVPINQWTFNHTNNDINEVLNNIKNEAMHGDTEKMVMTLTESNMLIIITSLSREVMIKKIKGHGFDDIDMSRFNSRSQCLLTLSRININVQWPKQLTTASNIKFDLGGNSIIQFDLCEEIYLCKNCYGDYVVYYHIPINNNKGYLGFRYTYMKSDESTFINLVKISPYWTKFLGIGSHTFNGVRLPAFTKKISSDILSSIKPNRYRTGKVISVHTASTFSMNKNGHTISESPSEIDDCISNIDTVENTPRYLNFYESSSNGIPISTTMFTEVFYVDKIGACFDTVPILQTIVNNSDII
jgi:hypothetical protein